MMMVKAHTGLLWDPGEEEVRVEVVSPFRYGPKHIFLVTVRIP